MDRYNKTAKLSQFGITPVPYHTHNGIDSPKLNIISSFSGTTTYAGSLNADASVVFLPSGWTATVGTGGGLGSYTITHNLGTTNYAVSYTITVDLTITIGNISSVSANSFVIRFYNQTGSISWSRADTPFNFILAMN